MQRRLRDSLPVWLKVNALLLQQRPLAVNCGATAPRAVEPADAPISSNHTMSRNLISGRAPRIRCEWVPPHALAHRSRTAACHSRKLAVRGDAAGRDAADQGKDRLLERSQSHGGGSKKKNTHRALLPATRCQSSGPLGALLSSPALGVRLPTALQVLQVRAQLLGAMACETCFYPCPHCPGSTSAYGRFICWPHPPISEGGTDIGGGTGTDISPGRPPPPPPGPPPPGPPPPP